jgi:hypothetical protein
MTSPEPEDAERQSPPAAAPSSPAGPPSPPASRPAPPAPGSAGYLLAPPGSAGQPAPAPPVVGHPAAGQVAGQPPPVVGQSRQAVPHQRVPAAPGQPEAYGQPAGQGRPAPPGATQPQPGTVLWSTAVRPASGAAAATAAGAATAVAGAAATTAPVAPRAEPLAIPDAGRHGPPGTSPENGGPHRGNGQPRPSGRLAKLRIGSHTVSRSALAQLRVAPAGTGLLLGADRNQGPVLVSFFRPTPTRVTLVGGVWAGQLMAFRALALGARVVVVTADPYAWQGFGERATGQGDRVTVMTAEQPLALIATVQQPVLIVYDQGGVGAVTPQPLGPWQTQLTILRRLDRAGVSSVQDCDLVVLQRLAGAEAALAGDALRLPAPSTQLLQAMADDMVALIGGGADRYVWLTQTEVERQYAGAPRR